MSWQLCSQPSVFSAHSSISVQGGEGGGGGGGLDRHLVQKLAVMITASAMGSLGSYQNKHWLCMMERPIQMQLAPSPAKTLTET